MLLYKQNQIETAIKAKGYVWFDSDTDYDVNIVGIRNNTVGTTVTNAFDDVISVSYKINGVDTYHQWECTTDPGTKAVKEFHAEQGVARVVPGQYRGSHAIGLHKGQYTALVQQRNITVYRDANKDMTFDESIKETGVFGINIHHAGPDSTLVENWSEGCQVFKRISDFDEFMLIITAASKVHGNSFTYTLLDSKDIT